MVGYMVKRYIDKELWVELNNDTLWDTISGLAIAYKGGGNTTSPKFKARPADLDIVEQGQKTYVIPNSRKGISFATTFERIERTKIRGHVWKIPKGTHLPFGLIFNVNTSEMDHPLLNVSTKMTVDEFMGALNSLSQKMQKTNYKL